MARVEMTIDSINQDLLTYEWVILLKDKSAERYIPIYVGQTQADIIKEEINKKAIEPEYCDFSVPGVDVASATLKSVLINRFENNIFFAKILLKHGNKSYRADYPVAKGIAFAIKEGAPIYVLESILNEASIHDRDYGCYNIQISSTTFISKSSRFVRSA